ncbi:efflux RND transporter periplasmic adaptor subunit [Patescibacteria group bacterium]|nr:efflux RND transporter periplasmic adaptor subunit [Patescibacteria group bacterium]MCL5797328.1 efflux RND transporter periplasmic adaptor subunit [Patescibacteria group bacterium]
MKNKKIFIIISLVALLVVAGIVIGNRNSLLSSARSNSGPTTTTSVRFVNSTITADGSVTAQNQATLNFQTSGKLTYLPFKEGDKVAQGQTIAQLDTYQLQRELTTSLNNYKIARDNFDQTQENANTGVLQGSQKYSLQVLNKGGFEASDVVGNIVKRVLEQNQSTLDNSVINVELANYALQLSKLTSPLDGIITHEDVVVPGINITTGTTFTIADPDSMVFRANVPTENIYYISDGSVVTLAIDGIKNKINGTVVKIYPSKVVLADGQAVYQVDIESDDLKKQAKLDESGRAIISTNSKNVALVPAWTVLAGKYIWVNNNGIPELRQVTIGKTHGNEIEITDGLSTHDKIITDPKYISSLKYQLL